jgi:hypothetical protein
MAFVFVERDDRTSYFVPEHRVLEISHCYETNMTRVIYRDADDDIMHGRFAGEPAFIGLVR